MEFKVRPATPKLAVPPAVLVPRDGRMSRLPFSFITWNAVEVCEVLQAVPS